MKRATLTLFLLAAVASAATIQRRSDREDAAGVRNAVGELTYTASADGATLTVGTRDRGNLHVTDPCAVHFAPRRLLSSGEYSVQLSSGAFWTEDGGICLATNVENNTCATNTATFRIVGSGDLATVQYDVSDLDGTATQTVSGGTIVIRGVVKTHQPAFRTEKGFLSLSNIRVYAYTTERHTATWDSVVDSVTLKDTIGSVEMSKLRQWEIKRTDGHLAEDWAKYAATARVKLAGNEVWLNRSGTVAAVNAGALATNAWSVVAYGNPVLSINPGFDPESPGNAFRVVDIDLKRGNDETCDLYVTAGLDAPVTIQYVLSLGDGAFWADEPIQTSSYPATVMRRGEPCYKITVPQHGDRCFWRAVCTTDVDAPTELHIANCDLYVDGRKVVWKQITVNGQSIRVLAEE